MTNKQNAKLNMAQRVHDTLSEYSALFSSVSPMQNAFLELGETLNNIRLVEQAQGQTTISTATRDKEDAETDMINHTLAAANCLYVIGINNHNNELQTQANLTTSSFIRLEDNEKLALAHRIEDLTANHTTELASFGLDAARMEVLTKAINDYQAIIAKPMDSVGARKQRTTSLQYLFPQLTSTLADKLDKMMILFKHTQPDFYDQYKTSRNLINTATRHRKPAENEPVASPNN